MSNFGQLSASSVTKFTNLLEPCKVLATSVSTLFLLSTQVLREDCSTFFVCLTIHDSGAYYIYSMSLTGSLLQHIQYNKVYLYQLPLKDIRITL
jgi:hypothetical protein